MLSRFHFVLVRDSILDFRRDYFHYCCFPKLLPRFLPCLLLQTRLETTTIFAEQYLKKALSDPSRNKARLCFHLRKTSKSARRHRPRLCIDSLNKNCLRRYTRYW